jgi:hypothetical protein
MGAQEQLAFAGQIGPAAGVVEAHTGHVSCAGRRAGSRGGIAHNGGAGGGGAASWGAEESGQGQTPAEFAGVAVAVAGAKAVPLGVGALPAAGLIAAGAVQDGDVVGELQAFGVGSVGNANDVALGGGGGGWDCKCEAVPRGAAHQQDHFGGRAAAEPEQAEGHQVPGFGRHPCDADLTAARPGGVEGCVHNTRCRGRETGSASASDVGS